MRINAKTKDCQLTVKVKLPAGASVDGQELYAFSRKFLRGFLKPQAAKRGTVRFTGPAGISLYDRLKKPITRYDFFFLIEQVVDAAQKLQRNGFLWSRAVWDIRHSYINETTKEVQVLYLPVSGLKQPLGDVMGFVESIIYSARPADGQEPDFLSRFAYCLRSLNGFDPKGIEGFISKEDPGIVSTIKKHSAGSSGFMTDKRGDYYRHYGADGDDDGPTGFLNEDGATGLLDEGEGTVLLSEQEDGTGRCPADCGGEETGLLAEERAHYPSLYRVLTEEAVPVNKPVFRLGKERSYVDYFVTNNNAVSRSHADIVTRGTRYFVIDLNSKNRTYINGQAIPAQYETEIVDGDRLKLGNEEFIFHA